MPTEQAEIVRRLQSVEREYYRNNNLNLPDHYHNGGIWPFVGGFYVAVLVKTGRLEEARRQLVKLAEVNWLGINEEWEFNEWCHGRTGRPMGYPHQAWSAGMYVLPTAAWPRAGCWCSTPKTVGESDQYDQTQ